MQKIFQIFTVKMKSGKIRKKRKQNCKGRNRQRHRQKRMQKSNQKSNQKNNQKNKIAVEENQNESDADLLLNGESGGRKFIRLFFRGLAELVNR